MIKELQGKLDEAKCLEDEKHHLENGIRCSTISLVNLFTFLYSTYRKRHSFKSSRDQRKASWHS